ncbi:MAG: PEP/pyruvate-binding domain-containing protein [Gemmatimonadota bacterium]
MRGKVSLTLILALLTAAPLAGQSEPSDAVPEARTLVLAMKSAERGPFARIRWFCADGTTLPPRPYACADRGGGHQHGELSDDASRLANLGYNVGTLYVVLSYDEFLDASHNFDRLRELVVQRYLWRVDDGWVERRSRYYRGARQVEDEEVAGKELLVRLLADTAWVRRNFLLAMELVRAIPHGRAPELLDSMRELALELGDADADFQRLRIKIHSAPDPGDIVAVGEFASAREDLDPESRTKLDSLVRVMEAYYRDDPRETLERYVGVEPFLTSGWQEMLLSLQESFASGSPGEIVAAAATVSARLRRDAQNSPNGRHNLKRLDLSLALQALIVRELSGAHGLALAGSASRRQPIIVAEAPTRWGAIGTTRSLIIAAYGRGFLSRRELQAQLDQVSALPAGGQLPAREYRDAIAYLQRSTVWGQHTAGYFFGDMVARYLRVEAATEHFVDDLLRSTVLLPLADLTDALARDANRELGLTHTIFDQAEAPLLYGLNPGVAAGLLEYVPSGSNGDFEFQPDRIYVLPQSYPHLPPVGGIITLSEGSSLSHLQLLARSLGIPNAVIAGNALEALRPYFGKEVLYVVSPLGWVILKEVAELSPEQRALLAERIRSPAVRVSIDPGRLDLSERRVLSLGELDLAESGMSMGPKAAGVARLHGVFSGRVAPGLVVPFGVFSEHLERRERPGAPSLYEEMVAFYAKVDDMEREGRSRSEVESYADQRLAYFRQEIIRRELDPAFVEELREKLAAWGPEGSYGVFVRSDTNVEDLAGFSGAGLNLTVPNKVGFEDVLAAIKQVWASTFEERAYTWRKSVIDTPEHTYVSVLLQRSVPSEKSGVLITADLRNGRRDRITVSASEGPAGVVSGELAESLVIPFEGKPQLLAQAKAPYRLRMRFDGEGGVESVPTSGSDYVLTEDEIGQLVMLTHELERTFTPALDSQGRELPWDVEFGFVKGELRLFQIRPLTSDPVTLSLAGLAKLDHVALERGTLPVDLQQPISRWGGA